MAGFRGGRARVAAALLALALSAGPVAAQTPPSSDPARARFEAEMAEAEARREALGLYNACEQISPWPVDFDQWPPGEDYGERFEALNQAVRERLDEWGLLHGDDGPFAGNAWFYPAVRVSASGTVASVRLAKRLQDEYGNSGWMDTWEHEAPPPPEVSDDGAAEAALLAVVDKFAAAYLRVNALSCR